MSPFSACTLTIAPAARAAPNRRSSASSPMPNSLIMKTFTLGYPAATSLGISASVSSVASETTT